MSTQRAALILRNLPVPSEHAEQKALFEWAFTQRVTHPELRWLHSIPNVGGFGKGAIIRGAKMVREGLRKGYPDLALDLARAEFHGLRIEIKRRRDSHLSDDQRAWAAWLIEQGYAWHLCFGWEQARDVLLGYLALPRTGVVA